MMGWVGGGFEFFEKEKDIGGGSKFFGKEKMQVMM